MRRTLLKALAVALAIVGAVVLAGLLYLRFGNLDRHRGTVERLVTGATGRELRIAGGLDLDVGLDTTIRAADLTLANPDWATAPSMVSVDRLELSISLWSLVVAPVRVHHLSVSGAEVHLEDLGDGRTNWTFDTGGGRGGDPAGPPRLSLGSIDVADATLTYRGPAAGRPVRLLIDRLSVASDSSDMLDAELAGTLNGADLAVAGRLGTLAGILQAGQLSLDVHGRLGGTELVVAGRVEELSTLAGADLEVRVDGAAMSEVTGLLGLPDLGEGAFRIAARARPSERGCDLELDSVLGEVTVRASGVTDALLAPALLDVEAEASGPSLAAVAELAGLRGTADQPFSVSGHLRWEGFPITFDDVSLTVGDNRVSLDGTLGAPPTLLGTDIRVSAGGPDVSSIARLAGLELPPGSFRLSGHLVRLENGIGIEDLEAAVGPSEIRVAGRLGDPPGHPGTDLTVSARGPDLSAFSGLAGVRLPGLPFSLDGRLVPDGDTIRLESASATLGANTASAEGTVRAVTGFAGSELRAEVAGPGLQWLEQVTGLSGLPQRPYRAAGTILVDSGSLRLDEVEARIGDVSATLDGRLGLKPTFIGTDLTLTAEGPDASSAASLAGVDGMPAEAFRIVAGVRRTGEGFELQGGRVEIGDSRASVTGVITPREGLEGSALRFDVETPDVSAFGPVVGLPGLPPLPLSARGSMQVGAAGVTVQQVTATLDELQAVITGTVGTSPGLDGSDAELAVRGPSLAGLGALAASVLRTELPNLPAEPFAVSGGLAIDGGRAWLREVRLELADARALVDGTIGRPPDFVGTDLSIDVEGPDASLLSTVSGLSVPVAPFRAVGRVRQREHGLRFDGLEVQLGEYRARANGRLGALPQLNGTDLEVEAGGPSLLLLSRLARIEDLPDLPFSLSGRFDGNPRRFQADRFAARLGSSDVHGTFRVDLEASRPRLNATLVSQRVDVRELVTEHLGDRPAGAAARLRGRGDGRVIADTTLDLAVLDRLDGSVELTVAELVMPATTFRDLRANATLEEGSLRVDPITGVGVHGGSLTAALSAIPGRAGYVVGVRLEIVDGRLDMSGADVDPGDWPALELELDLTGSGATARGLAASADGHLVLSLGEGVMDASLIDLLATDVLVNLLEILNPFRDREKTSRLECAVVAVEVSDGVARFDPVAVQSQTVTMVGGGTVDLATERISFDWVTKPRTGVGLSASVITNPYIRLGGTLASPSVEVKPIEAVASTGLAVVTGGLSLLGKGLLDRITAEQDVCTRALEAVASKLEQQAEADPSP